MDQVLITESNADYCALEICSDYPRARGALILQAGLHPRQVLRNCPE